jgi:hypothetical protein
MRRLNCGATNSAVTDRSYNGAIGTLRPGRWCSIQMLINYFTCMPKRNKSAKTIDQRLQDRSRELTRKVAANQRHLDEIAGEIKGIKRVLRKNVKRDG